MEQCRNNLPEFSVAKRVEDHMLQIMSSASEIKFYDDYKFENDQPNNQR